MPDFLTAPFIAAEPLGLLEVLVRLISALALGWVVSWIYKATRSAGEITSSFPPTLVLLSVLIAMVTQVIGDSVARAFSLVGALSIVRFRTVVRDTQDTAFVIFAVVVGMATGASDPRVALIGIGVVGVAAFLMRRKATAVDSAAGYVLKVRTALNVDLTGTIAASLDEHVAERRLTGVSTARQGIALDLEYEVRLRPKSSLEEIVRTLNRIEGVQSVEIAARTPTDPSF